MIQDLPDTGNAAAPLDRQTYPIRTVAALTGVSAFTLRAWERRYGLVAPRRTTGGQRMYTRGDVDRIGRILDLLASGMAIGQVAGVLDVEDLPEGAAPVPEDFWAGLRRRMAERIAALDEPGLEAAYQDALALYPIEQVTERLLRPLLRDLGTRWLTSEQGIVDERFFSVYLRNKLGARFHHRRALVEGPLLVCACLPGERHDMGLLLFALAAHDRGYRTLLLGDMPLSAVAAAALSSRADAIALSGFVEPPPEVWTEALPALTTASAIPVFLGGPVSLAYRGRIAATGTYALGCDLNAAFRRIGEIIRQS